ncbi:MAG: GWxTD domain-containing protein [Ignavibacteriales bacterium]|nr:GWxTD domain-containing protein [Ignavibacteriales bacterium]
MLVCVNDTTISSLKYSINKVEKVILQDSSNDYFDGTINIVNNNNSFLIKENKEKKAQRIFTISNFSNLLVEGKYEIEFSLKNEKSKYPIEVVWINKPKVLYNPEYAIKLISYIDDDEVVKDLLFRDEEKYYEGLFDYWNIKYPTNGTKFNFAMNEYYTRADYAIENFSSLNSIDGAETDRGRIYITYGKPSSVERNYSEKNEIMEIWHYEKISRDYIFKDTSGTGKFSLVR